MPLTMSDMQPVSLCLVTQDLFDAKRFQKNFCDNLLLRARDKSLEDAIMPTKRELISPEREKRFLDGYKAVIVNNIDKILSLVSRYAQINYKTVEDIVVNGKDLIKRVMLADNFEQIASLDPIFKSKVNLPTYQLFTEYTKRRG